MINPDLLISLGIGLCGVGMTAIGIETTLRPPTDKTKRWYRGAFIFLGGMFICLSILQFDRADKENKRQADQRTQEQLRNEGNLRYMQGQLDTQNGLLKILTVNSTPQQWAAAIKGVVAPATQKTTTPKTRLSEISNAALREIGIKQAQAIRVIAQKPLDVLNQQGGGDQLQFASAEAMMEYQNKYQADAIVVRDEIISRLPVTLRRSQWDDLLYSMANNPSVLKDVAADLEALAKKLP